MPTSDEILTQLRKVKYPGYTRDIVSFGIVRDIEIAGSTVRVTLATTTQNPNTAAQIRADVKRAVREFTGAEPEIVVEDAAPSRAWGVPGPQPVAGVRHVLAVASGKGGVGKSTVATNLALALRAQGARVGLLDADVYGPSIPLLLGLHERPRTTEDRRILPLERYGIQAISLGSFLDRGTPVIWRGPMVSKLLTQFFRDVHWGDLDYLVIDLPPGTGDAQLTVAQQVRLAGGIIVTTPQRVALLDVERGVTMFRQLHAPVLGVIENMSYHTCSGCGRRAALFGSGGGKRIAAEFGIPFLGEIPLVRELREACDRGAPLVAVAPEHAQSQVFLAIAQRVVAELRYDRASRSDIPRPSVPPR